MSDRAIVDGFFDSSIFKDYSQGHILNLERCFRLFLTAPEGLSSIMEEEDIQKCITLIFMDVRRRY